MFCKPMTFKTSFWIKRWFTWAKINCMFEEGCSKKAKWVGYHLSGANLQFTCPLSTCHFYSVKATTQTYVEICDWETLTLEEAVIALGRLTEGTSMHNIVRVLQKCRKEKNLAFANRMHMYLCDHGLDEYAAIGNYLIPVLADCGGLSDAQQVFDKLKHGNVHSWTFLIQGYLECGEYKCMLNLYQRMKEQNVPPTCHTLQLIIKACAKLKDVERGQEAHAEIIKGTFEGNRFVASTLVDMYAKCGLLVEAREVFDELVVQDIFSWTALMTGYAEHGPWEEVLKCLDKMQTEGAFRDAVTFVCSLKACSSLGVTQKGREIHVEIVKVGLEGQPFVSSILVDMYAKHASLVEAEKVFDRVLVRDVVLWNVIIASYATHGQGEKAANCLEKMRHEGVSPNALTFISLLKGCDGLGAIGKVEGIYREISKEGLERDPLVGSVLVDLYAKCGALCEARQVFDKLLSRNVVSWTALISGYVDHGFGAEALNLLQQMQADGVSPNGVTFLCCLKACGLTGALDRGRELHAEIAIEGFESDQSVGNTLVDMYARCGMLLEAEDLFDELQVRDVVSWNTLSSRYTEYGLDEEALKCLEQMQCEGVIPDRLSYLCGLKACGCVGAINRGQELHAEVGREGLEQDSFVCSTLVDMYAKCGLLVEAHDVFENLPSHDVVVWNALLAGYACQGEFECVFNLFGKMMVQDVQPHGIPFLCVLTACSHAGLLVDGQTCFKVLMKDHGILLTMQHNNCMVDLLGRAGHLEEAVILIQNLPFQPNLVTWSTLLGACRKWGDVDLAREAFESAYATDEMHASLFVSMSRIYADAHMWEDASVMDAMRLNIPVFVEPATILFEVADDCKQWRTQYDRDATRNIQL